MTLKKFIQENRAELDHRISYGKKNFILRNEERRLWILNDEGLYNWAKSQGVKI